MEKENNLSPEAENTVPGQGDTMYKTSQQKRRSELDAQWDREPDASFLRGLRTRHFPGLEVGSWSCCV